MIPVTDAAQGAVFAVRLQPGAKRNAILGTLGDALKIALTTPPIEGRANDALVEFLSDRLHVPRSAIQITAGAHSRNKRVCVAGRSATIIEAAIAAACRNPLAPPPD
jgi:hypothetical protein